MVTWIVLLVFGISLLVFKLTVRPQNFPPGPKGWPLFGNVSLVSKDKLLHIRLQDLAQTYGPVTGMFLGPVTPFISVVGYEAVKEVLHNDDIISRPAAALIQSRSFGERLGILLNEGPDWQEQRRFTLRHLRDLGFGKTSIEDQMVDEIQELINEIKQSSQSDPDGLVEFEGLFHVSVINILWAIIGGKRFQRNDTTFKKILFSVELFLKKSNAVRGNLPVPSILVHHFPWIPKLLGVDPELFVPITTLIQETIDEHLANRSEGDAPRDFIDVYLDEMNNRRGKESHGSTSLTRKQLIINIIDLFGAGSDTSSNTIGFAILYLIHNQQVQREMSHELDRVCGDSLPSLAHRNSLPYTEAFIMEVLRMGSIVALAVPHVASRDTKIQGFHIPKGSVVIVNLDSISKDGTIWKDPDHFSPERHLNSDGKVVKNEALIPFGIGKRACLGEPLARNTVFLFVTALVKTFEFLAVPNQPLPTLEPIAGVTLGPKPYKAIVRLRYSK